MSTVETPLSSLPLPPLAAGAPAAWRAVLAQLAQDAEAGAWSAVCYDLHEMLTELLSWYASVAMVARGMDDSAPLQLENQPVFWRGLLNSGMASLDGSPLSEAVRAVFRTEGDVPPAHTVLLGMAEPPDTASVPWGEWAGQLFGTPRYADAPTCQRLAVWGWKALCAWLLASADFFAAWTFHVEQGEPRLSHGPQHFSLFPFYACDGDDLGVLAGFCHNQPWWRNLSTGRPFRADKPLPAWLSPVHNNHVPSPEWAGLHPPSTLDPRRVELEAIVCRLGELIEKTDSGYIFAQGAPGLGRHYLMDMLAEERPGAQTSSPPLLLARLTPEDVPDPRLWLHRLEEQVRSGPLPSTARLPAPETVHEMWNDIEDPTERFSRWATALAALNGGSVRLGLELEPAIDNDVPTTGVGEFLPETLPPHVTVVVSARLESLPAADRQSLEALRSKAAGVFTMDQAETANLDFLSAYLKDKTTDLRESDLRAEALRRADCRILWLRLFDRAFAANLFDSPQQLLLAGDFYAAILRQMADRLGQRMFEMRALPLLLAMAACREPVTHEALWQWDGYRADTGWLVARLGVLLRGGSRVGLLHETLLRHLLETQAEAVPPTGRWLTRWGLQSRHVGPDIVEHFYGWALLADESVAAAGSTAIADALEARCHKLQDQRMAARALALLQNWYLCLRMVRDTHPDVDVTAGLARARVLRGQLYYALGETQMALTEFAAVVAMGETPFLVPALQGRAAALLESECEAEAQADWQQAFELLGADGDARTQAENAMLGGRILTGSQAGTALLQFRLAIDWYRKAEGSPAMLATAWLSLADLQGSLDQPSDALQSYTEALQALGASTDVASRNLMARALSGRCQCRVQLGHGMDNGEDLVRLVDVNEALVTQDHLLTRRFDLALAHHSLGTLLTATGEVFRCLSHERRAVSLIDELLRDEANERMEVLRAQALAVSAAAALRVGETSWALEDATAAVETYQGVLEVNPQAPVYEGLLQTLALRREALMAIGDWARAQQDADRAIAVAGPFRALLAEAFADRAEILRMQRLYSRALADVESSLDLLPEPGSEGLNAAQKRTLARVWRERASTLLAIGDPRGAVADLDRALDVERAGEDSETLLVERASAFTDRGSAKLALGQVEAARSDLTEAMALWDRLHETQDTRRVQGRAWTMLQQGRLHVLLRQYPEAQAVIGRAVELYRRSLYQESKRRPQADLAAACVSLGEAWAGSGHLERALDAWDEAVGIFEALLLQQQDVDVMVQLADALTERAETMVHRHGMHRSFADLDRSLSLYLQALSERDLRRRQCRTHHVRAQIHLALGRAAEALTEASRALELAATLRQGSPSTADEGRRAAIHQLRADAYFRMERLELAHEEFSRSIDVYERVVTEDPTLVGGLARSRVRRAAVSLAMGTPGPALTDCQLAERELQLRGVTASRAEDLGFVYDQEARIHAALGEMGLAESRMQEAVGLYTLAAGGRHDSRIHVPMALAYSWLADIAYANGDYTEGLERWRLATRTLKGAPVDRPGMLAMAWRDLSSMAAAGRRDDQADEAATFAVRILDSAQHRRNRPDLAELLHGARLQRFHARLRLGRWAEALEDAGPLAALERDLLARARLVAWRGVLHYRLKQWGEARDAYREALETYQDMPRERGALTVNERARMHSNLGLVFLEQHEWDRAVREFSRAIEFRRTLLLPEPPADVQYDLACTHYNRGTAHARTKQWEQAVADFEEALTLFGTLQPLRDVREMLALVLNNLAEAKADSGHELEALERLDEALGLYAQLIVEQPDVGDHEGFALSTYNRAILYQKLDRPESAGQDYDVAQRVLTRLVEVYDRRDLSEDLKACREMLQAIQAGVETPAS